jgi:plasmid stabilization system protein ParE
MGKDTLKPTDKQKTLIVKEHFYHNLYDVLEYTAETFGKVVAKKFKNKVEKAIKILPDLYGGYPKNKFLLNTDKKIYCNVIMNSYYIVLV